MATKIAGHCSNCMMKYEACLCDKDEAEQPQTRDVTQTMLHLADKQKIASCLRAVILFYSPNWDESQKLEWTQLTNGADATTKGLADRWRQVLRETGYPRWADQ